MIMRSRSQRLRFPASNARRLLMGDLRRLLWFAVQVIFFLDLAAGQSRQEVEVLIRSGKAALDSGNFARPSLTFSRLGKSRLRMWRSITGYCSVTCKPEI